MRLSRTLHILGVIMHYQDNEILGNMVILNRQWATDALYRVLDNEIVTAKKGWFSKSDAKKIWDEPKYKDKTNELLELMNEFKMCYLNDSTKRYVVPSKLQLDPPENPKWNDNENVSLHLQYDWLPRPLVTQLMVTLHKFIAEEQTWIWRRGAVIDGAELDAKDAQARIVENLKGNKIEISARGKLSEYLIKSIMDKWKELNQLYEGKVEVNRIIICNCERCKVEKHPFEFDYGDVLDAKAANDKLRCNKSRRDMTASEILRGVFDENTVDQDFQIKYPNIMNIENIYNQGSGQLNIAGRDMNIQNNASLSIEDFDKYVKALGLSNQQILEIKQIEGKTNDSSLEESKVLALLDRIDENLSAIKNDLPVPVVNKIEEVKKLQTGMSLDGKFKASIPIIPFILHYELEGKNNLKDIFKQIWIDMKNGEYFLKKETK